MSYNNYNYPYGGYGSNNRYYPQYNTQPIQQQMQPMFQSQNQVQQPIQQNPSEVPIQEIRYLTADEIKAYIVMAGTKAALIDRENKLIHIKYADMTGQSSVKIYSYSEFEGDIASQGVKTPQIDLDSFVKKDDLNGFVKAEDLKQFSAKLDEKFTSIEKKIKISEFLEGDKK